MSNFTYEFENRRERLETYEWDNVWWEHAGTVGVPRVLYIGDSISCAARTVATSVADETLFFDGFGTSKAVDNPHFADAIRLFALQQGERRAIIFNNGLHGWHLDDECEYAEYYEKMIEFLLKEFNGTPLLLLLTTHVADTERDERVQARNRAVNKLAQKHGLPVIDLYTITKEHEDLLSPDGVHLVSDGYRLIAEEIVGHMHKFI